MNKSESKYFNTAVKMDEALLSLLEKKEFEYITIKEICAEAGVNRSTFYLHYETTRDLLIEAMEYMNRNFQSYFASDDKETMAKVESGSLDELIFITEEHLEPYLNYIKEHKRIFAAVLKNPENFASEQAFKRLSKQVFYPILERFQIPERERDYTLMFYVKGLIGVITEWIKHDCEEPVAFIMELMMKLILREERESF